MSTCRARSTYYLITGWKEKAPPGMIDEAQRYNLVTRKVKQRQLLSGFVVHNVLDTQGDGLSLYGLLLS